MKKVCVLGLGYIGLPTAVMLAENNVYVIGVDIDKNKVTSINNGDPVIEEPEIYQKLHIALHRKTFKATTILESADYFVIAVPTPFDKKPSVSAQDCSKSSLSRPLINLPKADMTYVKAAIKSICKVIKPGNTILIESTIPVGATAKMAALVEEKTKLKAGKDFYIAHCPERVLPGKICKELVENDRVIGGINYESAHKASLLYDAFVAGNIHLTDDKTAEMVKLVENSCRDAQIAFAHQIAVLAHTAKINPYEVIELANKHPRVNILKPTCGVGGHCIAIDPWFLVESFPHNSDFIRAARETNDKRPKQVLKIIEKNIKKWKLANNNKHCTVLLLGLTYKPDVDDLRESPALFISKEMLQRTKKYVTKNTHTPEKNHWQNTTILVSEPNIKTQILDKLFGASGVNLQEGLEKADIIVYLVSHKKFKSINKNLLKNKLILDFCGITYKQKFSPEKPSSHGMLDFFITNSSDTSQTWLNQGE